MYEKKIESSGLDLFLYQQSEPSLCFFLFQRDIGSIIMANY